MPGFFDGTCGNCRRRGNDSKCSRSKGFKAEAKVAKKEEKDRSKEEITIRSKRVTARPAKYSE